MFESHLNVFRASLVAQMVNNVPAMWETCVWSLGQEDPLEKGMATQNASIFASTGDMGSIPGLGGSRILTTKPVCHNYWAWAPEPGSCNCWVHMMELLKPECPRASALEPEKSLQCKACYRN